MHSGHIPTEVSALSGINERFGSAILSAGSGVAIKNKEGIITGWNMGAQYITGFSAEEVIGKNEDIYLYAPKAQELKDANKRCLDGENINHIETWITHKNGKIVICSTSFSPVTNDDNEITGLVVIFHDVTADIEVEQKSRKLAAIVACVDAGIIIKDKNDIIEEWNIGAENITGYTRNEIIGKRIEDYTPHEYHEDMDKIRELLREGKHFAHVEVIRRHKNNCLIDCSASYTPIFDDNGEFSGSVEIFQDISGRKQMERNLRDSVIAAEEASRMKSSFIANMSHEIRTPMNGIIGFAELLLGEPDISERVRDFSNKIKISAVGLLGIINDILDISKIEAGKMEVEKTLFQLNDILKQCELISTVKINKNKVKLIIASKPKLEKKLLGDPTRLRQALINLLSNAIKFTEEGEIRLSYFLEKKRDNKMLIRFEVTDTGIGMTPEQIKKIFDPFTQADNTTTRKYGGTGLGLTITKNIIELMGSELKVESKEGVGSKFSFTLNFEVDEYSHEDMGEAEKIIEMPMFSGEVLVCEDNKINMQVIKEHLSKVGLSAIVAENGRLGVDAVKERMAECKEFDIILMDINMPEMDGLEASKELMEIGNKSPIIALTANAMTKDKELYLQSGMVDYISKPFVQQELWQCLSKYLEPVKSGNNLSVIRDNSIEPVKSIDSVMLVDRVLGIKHTAGSEKLYHKLLESFLEDSRGVCNKIKEAISIGDIKLAHRIAHTLSGNAGLIGSLELKKAAATVEKSLKGGKAEFTKAQMNYLENILKIVLDEITVLIEDNTKKAAKKKSVGEFNKESAVKILNKLSPLLKAGDLESLDMIDEVEDVFMPLGELGSKLISNMMDFEFESAFKITNIINQEIIKV